MTKPEELPVKPSVKTYENPWGETIIENPFPGLHYSAWGTLIEFHEYINGIEIVPEHRRSLQLYGKESEYYEYYNPDKPVPDANNEGTA